MGQPGPSGAGRATGGAAGGRGTPRSAGLGDGTEPLPPLPAFMVIVG
ncbi:hypothetical protein HUV60_022205 [Streptomyces sp. KMM 9044]|nr:hypothetical protein [Streptomyces sp. KMM 9044]WAX79974.1 hypothetical protein HUV60_022205 [Streptomyces sp. KMM 9044]